VNVDPIAAILNPAAVSQTLHMTLAAYAATGFGVAGIHAGLLLAKPANVFHRRALAVGLLVGAPAALLQPLSGDFSAKMVAEHQPAKFAAMEGHFRTERGAPFVLGGIPDMETQTVRYAIEIPKVLSFLAHGDVDAEVKGLDQVPREDWANVPLVHWSFQLMVGFGMFMVLCSLLAGWTAFRRRELAENRLLMRLLVLSAPMGFLAVEAGWMVTELGRQPWVIQGVMRTAEAVTPMPGLIVPFTFFSLLYVALSVAVVWLMRRQILKSPDIEERPPLAAPLPQGA
jgi:cytochrome d ubiquinol oxidase subunit I